MPAPLAASKSNVRRSLAALFGAIREVHVMFSDKEISYIKSQRLARIATASSELQPDVAPVGFDFDGTYFYVGD
jgi:hypothetical protein